MHIKTKSTSQVLHDSFYKSTFEFREILYL